MDPRLETHLEACKERYEQLQKDGTWPWDGDSCDTITGETSGGADSAKGILSSESIAAMEELGLALKEIYLSLRAKGYRVVGGQLISPSDHENGDPKREGNHQGDKERQIP